MATDKRFFGQQRLVFFQHLGNEDGAAVFQVKCSVSAVAFAIQDIPDINDLRVFRTPERNAPGLCSSFIVIGCYFQLMLVKLLLLAFLKQRSTASSKTAVSIGLSR